MPLVNAKCTNCGGTLTVDASKDAAICDFCGSPFIVEKAIQNYNYHITNNITAQNVIIAGKGEMEKERLLQNAKTQLDFKDYATARSIFQEVSTDYPDDYRAWYGMASIDTEEFKKVDLSAAEFQQVCSFIDRALMTTTPDQKSEIEAEWKIYLAKHLDFLKQKKAELADLERQLSETNGKINNSQRIIDNQSIIQSKTSHIPFLLLIILILAATLIVFKTVDYFHHADDIITFIIIVQMIPFVIILSKECIERKRNTSKDRKKAIIVLLLIFSLPSGAFAIIALADGELGLSIIPLILFGAFILLAIIFGAVNKAKAINAKNARVQRENTINTAHNNIQNYNQCVSMISGKITEMKSRYNI